MADKESRGELAIAPGQHYIEVEYDYEYTFKERFISIKHGECFMLVKKTNGDWWQVKKDENSKPFYVPAQYVREVRKALMPPPKALPLGGSSKPKPAIPEIRTSNENLNRNPETRVIPPSQPRDANQNLPSPRQVKNPVEHFPNNNSSSVQPRRPTDAPSTRSTDHSRSPIATRRSPLDLDRTTPASDSPGGSSERIHNDSESGDDLSTSSTEAILQTVSPTGQGGPDTPVYTNLQELKVSQSSLPPPPSGSPLQTVGDWETYRDASGRNYYYNRNTQERSWKPPRIRDAPTSLESWSLLANGRGRRYSQRHSSSGRSASSCGSVPGWSEEQDERGHTLCISDWTNEKWVKHADEQGRPYFSSADGSRVEWELPKHEPPPPKPADLHMKTRSLDRRQLEPILPPNWRHSSYVLEVNEKLNKPRCSRSERLKLVLSGVADQEQDSPTSPKHPFPDSDSCPSSPKAPASPSERSGVLNVTKITENGKKVRKNWTSSGTVLQGYSLLFAKAQGGGTSWKFGSQSKPEFTVDLRGASVDWAAKDKTSKKHVIEVKTRQGSELLIQHESDGVISEWFRALTDAVASHPEADVDQEMPETPAPEKLDKDRETRDSKKGRAIKPSPSMDSAEQKKTKVKLKKFLTRRPTLQAVRDKGYIKDQVFGCSLVSLCQRENATVPKFVKMCIDHVENNGLDVDGLYRVSGNLAVIQKLRFAVNHDEKVDLASPMWEDMHVTTGALKMFFRELPEPLFTYAQFNDFVNGIKSSDYKQRVASIKDQVKKLPKPNHDTMQALFKHLRKVVEHSEANRMTTQSVAIVFGPTLLRPETETWNMAVHMVYQNQIVELVLLEYEGIFGR